MTEDLPDFNSLLPAEQKAVAERLLRIEQSGYKPFWCARHDCDGMPHALTDEDGEEVFVAVEDTAGPGGEPVSGIVYEAGNGELFLPERDDDDPPDPTEPPYLTPFGRLVLDPKWNHNHARADQRLPPWIEKWTLFIMSGRGSGKTTTGVEFVTLCARKGLDGAIVGRRGTELVNTHVAEILKRAHPEFVPEHFASKDILVWPNGAITYLFSAERPENIRSVNLSYCWFDEAAWMDDIEAAWDNAVFATRKKSPGNPIHFLITSTPTGGKWVQEMEDDEDVIVRRVSTYANRANLDEDFLTSLVKKYEGTRKGRQELHGEVLRDVEGALWDDDMFGHLHFADAADYHSLIDGLDDRVLAVDPAGSKNKRSDETGIVGIGAMHFDEDGDPLAMSKEFVLGDATIKGTPSEWAERTFKAARLWRVRRIIAEKNFGGDMVKQVLSDYAKLHPETTCDENGEKFKIEVVHAAESKETRAEGVVGRYEQGHVTHVTCPHVLYADLSQMEKEQVTWIPPSRGGRMKSPNRIDALVWASRNIQSKVRYTAKTAGRNTLKMLKPRGTSRFTQRRAG